MDGFTFNNLFETKGIEYLIVILFLSLLIPFWIILNKKATVARKIQEALGVLTSQVLRIPQGLFYNKNHTWAHLEQSGTARVGVDDFLLRVVGDVSVTNLKLPGERFRKGDLMAEIAQKNKRLRIFAPISGEIVYTNNAVKEGSGWLNEDPYSKGWFYEVKPTNWKKETSTFLLAEEATQWITNELIRFKDFLNTSLSNHSLGPAMVALQEGGELRMNPLADLQPEIWEDFQKEFLD